MKVEKLYEYDIDPAADSAPAKLLRLVGKNRRVLEIGCSSGSQTRIMAKDLRCHVFAVEINPEAAERARPYCQQLIVGNIETMAAEQLAAGAPYDVVLFADVLEHLYSPRVALEKVRSLVAPGGFLLASVPNVTHAALVFEMMNGRFEYRDYGLLDSTHIRFFDRRAVLRLFEEAGYFVDYLDRVIVAPADTEFRVQPVEERDRLVLDYMRSRNPDSDTFQFIVRAIPATTDAESKSALVSAQQRIECLERELGELRKLLSRRESEVNWLAQRPYDRLIRFVRRIFAVGPQ